MDGAEIAKLMMDSQLKIALAKHAKRYSKRIEDQEEYIQEAWLRIAKKPSGMTAEFYENEGRKAIYASYLRRWRKNDVFKKTGRNENGISEAGIGIKKKIPNRMIHLYMDKYLDPEPEQLDWQYYEGQEEEMLSGTFGSSGWYNKYEGYSDLSRKEQDKIAFSLKNSSYQVGIPIGVAHCNGSRYHNIMFYYAVDSMGFVKRFSTKEEWRYTPTIPVSNNKCNSYASTAEFSGKIDLEAWEDIKSLGGNESWVSWVNSTIDRLKAYSAEV